LSSGQGSALCRPGILHTDLSPWKTVPRGVGAASGGWKLPRIVGTDVPDVAFEIAAGEGAAAVVHVLDVEQHGGSRGLCGGIDGVGVGDDEVWGLGLAVADLVGLGEKLAEGRIGDGTEHDHAVAEGELGVGDGVAGAHVDGLFLEAEGTDEPIDGGESVVVADGWDDGFSLVFHGDNLAPFVKVGLGKNGRRGLVLIRQGGGPPPLPPLTGDILRASLL